MRKPVSMIAIKGSTDVEDMLLNVAGVLAIAVDGSDRRQLTRGIGSIYASPEWTPDGDWVSMAIPSDGSYGVPEGLMSSFPVTCANGEYSIVQGLDIDEFSQSRIDATVAELAEERAAVAELGLV